MCRRGRLPRNDLTNSTLTITATRIPMPRYARPPSGSRMRPQHLIAHTVEDDRQHTLLGIRLSLHTDLVQISRACLLGERTLSRPRAWPSLGSYNCVRVVQQQAIQTARRVWPNEPWELQSRDVSYGGPSASSSHLTAFPAILCRRQVAS